MSSSSMSNYKYQVSNLSTPKLLVEAVSLKSKFLITSVKESDSFGSATEPGTFPKLYGLYGVCCYSFHSVGVKFF